MAKTEEQYWASQINIALEWRKANSRENDWARIEEVYEHRYGRAKDPHFNLVYMLASSLLPSLVYQNPSVINTPRRPEFQPWAAFFDGINNWLVGEMELKAALEEAILSAFLKNLVGIEIGYDFPERRLESSPEEMEFKPIPGILDRTRKTNQPFLDIIDARRLLIAPNTKTMRNCWWYGKLVTRPTEELKKLPDIIIKNVVATHSPDQVKDGQKDIDAYDPERKYTSFWVIHDADKGKWSWITTDGKFILSPETDPLQVEGLPMEPLVFNKGAKYIWGVPDAIYIETQQMESDESRRDGRLQSRGANLKCFYDTNLLDENDIAKFITSDAMGCIPVTVPQDKKLGDVIQMVQPHVQTERFEYQKQLLNDAQLLLGIGPNQFGTFAPGRRTKFETQVVEESHVLRTGARRASIAHVVERLFGLLNQLIVREWKAPTVAKVIGIDAAVYYVKAAPNELKDLRSQLVTTVNVESLAPTSRERKKQEMVEVMGVLAKFANLPGINLFPIIQNFLSQFDWADVTRVLPQAQGDVLNASQFRDQQLGLLQGGGLGQQVQANLGGIGGLIGGLPQEVNNGGSAQNAEG